MNNERPFPSRPFPSPRDRQATVSSMAQIGQYETAVLLSDGTLWAVRREQGRHDSMDPGGDWDRWRWERIPSPPADRDDGACAYAFPCRKLP